MTCLFVSTSMDVAARRQIRRQSLRVVMCVCAAMLIMSADINKFSAIRDTSLTVILISFIIRL